MKKLLFIVMLFPLIVLGQLATSTSQSPAALVQNVLLGPGVDVSNISYTGFNQAIGSFNYTGNKFGLTEGIVMTTGTVVNNGNGPQGPNDKADAGFDNQRPGYSQLQQFLKPGSTTKNAAILEFDFIPYADTVRFRYIFGSEEYREYVGSDFNDVFAFFISGPGINGLQNIAKLPNGTPVTINNVNDGSESSTGAYAAACNNCASFVHNGRGNNGPYNSNNQYIQYDGFTKPLEAVSKVQCGEKYHLIIAIADVNDGIYDSGIFLEANSLTSKEPINITQALSFDVFNDPTMMAEGCVSSTVTLTRQTTNLSAALTIPITVSGTATQGVDFTNIPSSITFAPGQQTVSFTFDALDDGILEGIETVILTFSIKDPCGNIVDRKLELKINDIQPVVVSAQASSIVCPGNQVEVIATPGGGSGPYTFLWNTGATTSSIFVNPTQTTTYTVAVTDNCLQQTATASVVVDVPVYIPVTANPIPDIVEICPYVEKELWVVPVNGSGPYTYEWRENGEIISTDSSLFVTPATSSVYTVTITDFCGSITDTVVRYTITSPPLLLTMSPDQLICPNDSATISVTATGGYGQYYYTWSTGATTAYTVVNPATSTTYTVTVFDECQTFTVDGQTTVEVTEPKADFVVSSHTLFNNLPITFQNLTTGGVTYEWEFGDGGTSTLVHPNHTYDDPNFYVITLIATNQIGCKDTVSKSINIQEEYYVYVPNVFTPDGNRSNNYFSASFFGIAKAETKIFNRWGELIFEAEDLDFMWDGTYNGAMSPDGTYVYKIKYLTNSDIEETITGHVTLLK